MSEVLEQNQQLQAAMHQITQQITGMFGGKLNMLSLAATISQIPDSKAILDNMWEEFDSDVIEMERELKDAYATQVPQSDMLALRNLVGEAVAAGKNSAHQTFTELVSLVEDLQGPKIKT